MIHLDLFSGIGGFAKGLQQAGIDIENHYYSEIDKHAKAIYKYKFKGAIDVGSVKHVRDFGIDRPQIITFGSPCQDFSIAGKRTGMGGTRSSLITHAIELIAQFRPDVFIWENVKGTFSSNDGADFWSIIQAFTNIGGYRLQWQLLNTAWFLPQNRERIYLVGTLGNRSSREIFPVRESVKDPDEIRQQQGDGLLVNCIDSNYHKGPDGKRTMIRALTETRTEEAKQLRKETKGKDFSPRRGKKLMERNDNNMNTITATQTVEQLVSITQIPRGNNKGGDFDKCPTISSSGFEYNNHLNFEKSIRRLTEIECERLQGFPDDWTKFGNYDGVIKEVAATNRYKCIGNAVTVDVVEAVGRAIMEVENAKI